MNQQTPNDIEFFFNVFEQGSVNLCLLINTDGIIIRLTSSFTANFGYTNDDLLGQHFSVLFEESDRRVNKPQKELEEVLHHGWSSDCNYLNCKDCRKVWVSGESLLVTDHNQTFIIKIFQNIHEHKVTEQESALEKEFSESILASIDDLIIVLSRSGDVIKYNKAFKLMNNGSYHFSHFLSRITYPERKMELERKIKEVIENGVSFKNYVIELVSRGAKNLVLEVGGQPLMDKTAGETVLLVMHDVTAFKKLEEDQEDMLGFVAHELRDPLTNLVLCNKLIEVSLEDEDKLTVHETLLRSKKNIDRLSRMVTELYNATKIHGGQMPLEITEFEADDIVLEAIAIVTHDRPSLRIRIDSEAKVRVRGDQFKLTQVVTNFLSNAIKYSEEEPDISVRLKTADDSLIVSVSDHGPGIPTTYLPYIFDRFFRIEKTRNLEGIGLGLYLCRRIIHAHYGRIWVESEENKGSTFYFSIPLKNSVT